MFEGKSETGGLKNRGSDMQTGYCRERPVPVKMRLVKAPRTHRTRMKLEIIREKTAPEQQIKYVYYGISGRENETGEK